MTMYDLRMMYRESSREEIMAAYEAMYLEAVDRSGGDRTLLHTAAALGDFEAMRRLLERGLRAGAKDRYGNFPLHALASLSYVGDCRPGGVTEEEVRACADLLFEAGASTMRKNEDGIPALCEAARFARYEIIEAAIAHGARLAMTDPDGNNPLHTACDWLSRPINYVDRGRSIGEEEQKAGYLRCIRALVEAGLDTEEKNDFGQTALDLAIESGVKEAAVILAGEEAAAAGGMNLFQALEKGDRESLRALLADGADAGEISDEGRFAGMTALGAACWLLDLEAVRCLLEGGADPNQKNADGEACLGRLLRTGECEGEFFWQRNDNSLCGRLLKLLWDAGMEKDGVVNDRSDTALTLACRKAYNEGQMDYHFAIALADGGCDVNRSDLGGVTALMLAAQFCDDTELFITLLEAGAGLDAADGKGDTPLHYAARNRSDNTAREMAELLFEFGFSKAEAMNNAGQTALEIAMEQENEPLVKLILTNG